MVQNPTINVGPSGSYASTQDRVSHPPSYEPTGGSNIYSTYDSTGVSRSTSYKPARDPFDYVPYDSKYRPGINSDYERQYNSVIDPQKNEQTRDSNFHSTYEATANTSHSASDKPTRGPPFKYAPYDQTSYPGTNYSYGERKYHSGVDPSNNQQMHSYGFDPSRHEETHGRNSKSSRYRRKKGPIANLSRHGPVHSPEFVSREPRHTGNGTSADILNQHDNFIKAWQQHRLNHMVIVLCIE
jgi:hypothetical protein